MPDIWCDAFGDRPARALRCALLRVFGALLVLWISPGSARAWGEEAHRMVGAIADTYLTPASRRQVVALLENDRLADGQPSGRSTLAQIAYWADEIKDTSWGRRRGAWHYDNIPLCGAPGASQYCRKGACASAQLSRHLRVLADTQAPLRSRNQSLKWVAHLMGDIHQPLHASNHRDRGGNTVQVSFFGERDNPPYGTLSLHAIWDVHMVRRLIRDRGGEGAIVAAVAARIDAQNRAAWERGGIADWIDESHRLAAAEVYPALPTAFSCAGRIAGVLAIGRAYYSKMAPVMEAQIHKAGIRLARVLNDVFSR